MFDFEKLEAYQLTKKSNVSTLKFIKRQKEIDDFIADQWKKASMNSLLRLVEGVGQISKAGKRQCLILAKRSVSECVAILQSQFELGLVDGKTYEDIYGKYEQANKMLLELYKSY